MPDLWVFGYGSLMWRPGFPYEEAMPASIQGAHRALCVYSVVHRGTRLRPGLVLGLDAGGLCLGVAFRVRKGSERETRIYLRAREQVTKVYREVSRRIQLNDSTGREVHAICYFVDRTHKQYAGNLGLAHQAHIVRNGYGRSGPNTEYLLKTIAHLRKIGIYDHRLERLAILLGLSRALRSLSLKL